MCAEIGVVNNNIARVVMNIIAKKTIKAQIIVML